MRSKPIRTLSPFVNTQVESCETPPRARTVDRFRLLVVGRRSRIPTRQIASARQTSPRPISRPAHAPAESGGQRNMDVIHGGWCGG